MLAVLCSDSMSFEGAGEQGCLAVVAILAATAVLKDWRACRLSLWLNPLAGMALATTPVYCSVPWVATGSSRSSAAVTCYEQGMINRAPSLSALTSGGRQRLSVTA